MCVVPAAPKGFVAVQDLQDAYQFTYPFGWQEVAVKGADIVYKDVVEPLESVSVTLTPTDKKDILEFGDIATVGLKLFCTMGPPHACRCCHAGGGRGGCTAPSHSTQTPTCEDNPSACRLHGRCDPCLHIIDRQLQ